MRAAGGCSAAALHACRACMPRARPCLPAPSPTCGASSGDLASSVLGFTLRRATERRRHAACGLFCTKDRLLLALLLLTAVLLLLTALVLQQQGGGASSRAGRRRGAAMVGDDEVAAAAAACPPPRASSMAGVGWAVWCAPLRGDCCGRTPPARHGHPHMGTCSIRAETHTSSCGSTRHSGGAPCCRRRGRQGVRKVRAVGWGW